MSYKLAFEITLKPFPWGGHLASVLLIFGAAVVARMIRKTPRWKEKGLWLYALAGFGSLFWLMSFPSEYLTYRDRLEAYRTGHYAVVEGTVEHFRPMPLGGHADESFWVQGVRFAYSDYVLSPCFNGTTAKGGPVREGLRARISFVDDCILKLEISTDSQGMSKAAPSALPPDTNR